MNGATASPTTGAWSASSTSRIARKSAANRMISAGDSPGNVANVTVSASSAACALAFGPPHAATPILQQSSGSHGTRMFQFLASCWEDAQ